MSLFRSLRHRAFALACLGQGVSLFGNKLNMITKQWWVVVHSGSAEAMAIIYMLEMIVLGPALLFGGIIVDRLAPAKVMLICDVFKGGLASLFAVLVYSEQLTIPILGVLVTGWALADAFWGPAYEALLPERLPPEDLASANALTSGAVNIADIAGPALGAVLIASGYMSVALALDAVSYFVAAGAILPLCRTAPPRRDPDQQAEIAPTENASLMREMRDGIAVVFAQPWLWVTSVLQSLWGGIDVAISFVVLPLVMVRGYGMDVGDVAVAHIVGAIGALLCSIWVGRQGALRPRAPYVYAQGIVLACCCVALGFVSSIYAICALSFLRGVSYSLSYLVWMESLQTTVPLRLFGRVVSLQMAALLLTSALAYWGFGQLLDSFASSPVFIGSGVVAAASTILALLHPKVRRFD